MQNGLKKGFQQKLNGSSPLRAPINESGHGVMSFMELTAIILLEDQLLLMDFQKGKVRTVCVTLLEMYGSLQMICTLMVQTTFSQSGEEVITNLNQVGGTCREDLSHSIKLRYCLWYHQDLTVVKH